MLRSIFFAAHATTTTTTLYCERQDSCLPIPSSHPWASLAWLASTYPLCQSPHTLIMAGHCPGREFDRSQPRKSVTSMEHYGKPCGSNICDPKTLCTRCSFRKSCCRRRKIDRDLVDLLAQVLWKCGSSDHPKISSSPVSLAQAGSSHQVSFKTILSPSAISLRGTFNLRN